MAESLLSINNRVSVPIIKVSIGNYNFGIYDETKINVDILGRSANLKITYPNYIESLQIQKVNGTINTYTLNLVYPLTSNDDPNFIDKILASVSKSRKITFTYGDGATPSFMYREEEAIITNVTSNIDVQSSKLTYNITAVSSSFRSASNNYNFPGYKNKKPSDVIKSLLINKIYGLQDIFYGMYDIAKVEQLGLIAGDDKAVPIEAKTNISILKYLSYLVECMTSINDNAESFTKSVRYILTIHDDTSNVLNGPYFKINSVITSATEINSLSYYTIDIGYPNKDLVMGFTVNDNQTYSILYNYASETKDIRNDYVYRLNDNGDMIRIYSPSVSNDSTFLKTTTADKTFWSQMTQFPINATLQLRGLLRAAVLMDYINVNVYFYGKKHISSGLYVITKQEDSISKSGYSTTLSLTRVGGTFLE